MKKLLLIFAAFVLTLTLAGCTGEEELPALPDEVTMADVDEYLGRPDVQYVDLRNFDDKMKAGYISGFEFIPFFDYLEYENILVRTDGDWTFAAEDIKDQAALRGLFNDEKAIFLMCAGGTRADYVKAALESLGYTNVFSVGGWSDYSGENKVLGDDSYVLDPLVKGDWTPGIYYGIDTLSGYTATVIINSKGGIEDVIFDAFYRSSTKQVLNTSYTLASGKTWKEEADMLAAFIVDNQGWDGIVLDETALDSGLNALTVPHHFIYINTDDSPDDVAGVTVGAEGFVLAWNQAIAQASTTDLGVVETTATPEDWAAAHEPAFEYVDGVYYGLDEASGYNVKVTIVDSVIVEVFFDAIYMVYDGCDDGAGNVDPLVDKATCADDMEVYHASTKQVLQEDYMLASGVTWAAEADLLAAAILDYQEWRTEWTIYDAGSHDKFDQTVQAVIDDLSGVTIGVEGFYAAWLEAIAQAEPAS